MAATYPVFIKHTFIGKATQSEPYTARAHSRYIQRQSATHSVDTYLMPDSYAARQRWFFDHENGLRKNGRVIDKFTITIPYVVSEDHARATLMAFGKALGNARAPFMFSLQGFDTTNHHAHFIFVDRDYETGKRVYGTTERNSSRTIKLEWEATANEMFAELGYDIRVKVHDGLEAENDNLPLEQEKEAATVEATETVSEDDMATIERAHDDAVSLAGNDVRLLQRTVRELNYLRDARAKVEHAQARYEFLVAERERAALEASLHKVQSLPILQNAQQAEEALQRHQKSNGKLRGIGVKVFGFELKTSARREAEAARQRAESARVAADIITQDQWEKDHHAERLHAEASEAERDAFMRRNELASMYGEEKTINEAEETFRQTIAKVVENTPEQAVRGAWEAGEITADEVRTYALESGNKELLADLEESLEVPEEGLEI